MKSTNYVIGSDNVVAHADSELVPNQSKGQSFNLVKIADLIRNPKPIHWTIHKIFERGAMNLLAGTYGSGKSLIAFDMAYCVAAGIAWNGHKVEQGSVVIVAGEGHSGISQRFAALSIKYGIDCPENIHLSELPANFLDPDGAELVHDAVEKICPDAALVVVDTLNRSFGKGDENNTADMTRFVNNIDANFRRSGKTMLIVHHTSKGNTGASRGSVVLPSACESEFIVKPNGDTQINLCCEKQKNAAKADPMQFDIKEVFLPAFDFDGEKASSVFIEQNNIPSVNIKKRASLTQDETHVMNAMAAVYKINPQPIPDFVKANYSIDKKHSVISILDWRNDAYKRLSVDSCGDEVNAKKAKFSRLRKSLSKKYQIVENDGFAWYYEMSEKQE